MKTSILIATFGDEEWQACAAGRPWESATAQAGTTEVIRYHDASGTLATARNTIAERAQSEWLCFLDADDALADNYMAEMAAALSRLDPTPWEGKTPPNALLVPAVQYVNEACEKIGEAGIPAWGQNLLDVNCAVIGTLIPRWLFTSTGGFRDLPALEDFDLWLRCVEAGASLVPVRNAVYIATVRASSRNSDQSIYARIRSEHEGLYPWADTRRYVRQAP